MVMVKRCLLALIICVAAAHAQEGGDVQAQILYAFQTEDINSLTSLVQNLTLKVKDDGNDPSLRYHLAHAQYRMGLLLEHAQAHRAEAALSDCVDELKPLVQKDVKSAEGYILQAACYGELASLSTMEGMVLRGRASDRLKSAAKLDPKNPRLALITALQNLAHAKPDSVEHKAAVAELKNATTLFDAAQGTSIETPGWGHAEAYLTLGRELQARGDRVGARNLIEKALLDAPDYKAAQRQLASLTRP